jgi:hypothetical protein
MRPIVKYKWAGKGVGIDDYDDQRCQNKQQLVFAGAGLG